MTYIPGTAFAAAAHTHPMSALTDITAAGIALADDANASAQRTTLGLGTMALAATADYQALASEDAANGYAGLNAASRTTKGVDTTDDVVIDLATKGLVLKDTQGTPHYWRVAVTTLGVLTTADVGTTKP